MSLSVALVLLLVLLGIAVSLRSGRNAMLMGLIFVEAVASLLLLVAHITADYFTGEGINTAALFHVRYGFHGAGLQEYRSIILFAIITLVVAPLLIGSLVLFRRKQPRRTSSLIAGQFLLLTALVLNPATASLVALFSAPAPATADFYQHYHRPAIAETSSEHRNFVFIYAESLERTYFDEAVFPGLIVELRALEAEATSFTNIHTVHGTGFTMGGIVGSLCGIPLFTPAHANSMSGMDAFLPGAIGLTDLLRDEGYFFSYIGGASLEFAGKGKFFKTHGFAEASGFQELHPLIPDSQYINNWGLYDDTLFNLAVDRFHQLASRGQPFGLFLLTLDTHHPNGHVSQSAPRRSYGDGSNPMLNAVAASDALIGDFVRRLRASPAGKETVIVITSDHLAMQNSASELLKSVDRRNLFLILDPREPAGARVERAGSTLDVGVTLLSSLGYKGRIGLGRDLRDPFVPAAEIAHIQTTTTLLSWRDELARFWQFPRLKESLAFSLEPAAVTIDGRQFKAPVLIELGTNDQTTLRFEFDATWDVRLAQQTEQLKPGSRFLLFVEREDASSFTTHAAAPGDSPWLLVAGVAGQGHTVVPLNESRQFSKNAVHELLAKELMIQSEIQE